MKRNGEYSESRTFTVEKISRKHMKIMVKGAISGVYDIKVNNQGVEFIPLTMSNSMYLNPYATDYFNTFKEE